jgi:hypothetical protein
MDDNTVILGLPLLTFILLIAYPVLNFIWSVWYGVRNKYEGEDIEKELGLDDWYRTF